VPRRATGGDVNDPNWTCCSISAAAPPKTKNPAVKREAEEDWSR